MHDLVEDVLKWDRFYLSGRLQKPVCFCLLLMHLFPLLAILLIFMTFFSLHVLVRWNQSLFLYEFFNQKQCRNEFGSCYLQCFKLMMPGRL